MGNGMRQIRQSQIGAWLRPLAASAVIAGTMASVIGRPVGATDQESRLDDTTSCGAPSSTGDPAAVGDLVWLDADNDGVTNPDERGLAGVDLTLWADVDADGLFEPAGDDADGATCTTSTDADGTYAFLDVGAGPWFVVVTDGVPDGHVASTGTPIGDFDSVIGPVTTNGFSIDTVDHGFAPVAQPIPDPQPPTTGGPTCVSVGNRVWIDPNNDGLDGDETGIDGVILQLFEAGADGQPTGPVIATTISNATGYYLFSCVDPGRYVIQIPSDQFDDGAPLDGLRSSRDLPNAADDDRTDDGVDPANAGDAVRSRPIDLAIGDAPTGEPDRPAIDDMDFDAPADDSSDMTIDFGFTGLSLGNRVWFDNDGNGVQNGDEPGIDGVQIQLWSAGANGPIGDAPVATTTTANGGYYRFSGLTAGEWTVRVPSTNFADGAALVGHVSTSGNGVAPDPDSSDDLDDNGDPIAGASGPVQAQPVTLSAGDEPVGETDVAGPGDTRPSDDSANMTVDFGFVLAPVQPEPLSSLGDTVWFDTNRNGVQDAGEAGVDGVLISLRAPDGTVVATTSTNENGFYTFDDLAPGPYDVCFDLATLPSGTVPTVSNAGDDDSLDSDPGADGCVRGITLGAGERNPTIDLGIVETGADLRIDKTGVVDGNEIVWTITVTNDGPADATGPIVVSDTLINDLRLESVVTGPFDCTATGQVISCTTDADLAPGSSTSLTVRTSLTENARCTITNTARVSGGPETAPTSTYASNDTATATVERPCGDLPITGSNSMSLLVTAGLLAIAGGGLTFLARREQPISIARRLGGF